MLIGVKRRFVFIANSKTASTSIEEALVPYAEINRVGSPERKHISWQDARREYAFLFDQPAFSPDFFFKFGVVREPADWVISWFNYRVGNLKIDSPLPKDMTFYEFWNSNDWVKNTSQKSKFLDENGNFAFDVVLPQDQLGELFPIVSRILGVDVVLPTKNKSSGTQTRESVPVELIDEINKFNRDDHEFYLDWKERARSVLAGLSNARRNNFRISPRYTGRKDLQVLHAAIDVLPGSVSPHQAFSIGGVVVLGKETPQDCTLRIINRESKSDAGIVTWGIHSPVMAGKYPNAGNATNSRFKVEGLNVKSGLAYGLCLFKDGMNLGELFDIDLARIDGL